MPSGQATSVPDARRDSILWRTGMMTVWHDTCFTDAQRHNVTALYVTFRRLLHKLPRKSAGTRRAYGRASREGRREGGRMAKRMQSPELIAAKAAAEAQLLAFEPNIRAYAEGRMTADEYIAARWPLYHANELVRLLQRGAQ